MIGRVVPVALSVLVCAFLPACGPSAESTSRSAAAKRLSPVSTQRKTLARTTGFAANPAKASDVYENLVDALTRRDLGAACRLSSQYMRSADSSSSGSAAPGAAASNCARQLASALKSAELMSQGRWSDSCSFVASPSGRTECLRIHGKYEDAFKGLAGRPVSVYLQADSILGLLDTRVASVKYASRVEASSLTGARRYAVIKLVRTNGADTSGWFGNPLSIAQLGLVHGRWVLDMTR